jgi:hypothetical protein
MAENPMKEMSQLYSRVFLQILDSSIAEDFTVRHVFEDFLKLLDHKTGVLDMTRQALRRRLNIPEDVLNHAIEVLESPDPNSRDMEFEGRRIERLDEHRDWGWRVLNWPKYEAVRTKADVYLRVARHREKKKTENPPQGFSKPSMEQVKLYCSKAGISMADAEWFYHKCEGNGWKNGGRPIKSWEHTLVAWKTAKYLPSQKNGAPKHPAGVSDNMNAVIKNQEYKRVCDRIAKIRENAAQDAMGRIYTPAEKTELATLKNRQEVLKTELGIIQ